MTAKEKAKKLTDKFRIYATSRADDDGYCERTRKEASKQCALICVDEMLYIYAVKNKKGLSSYLKEVKQEINKL
jgi:hypothetical protein